MASGNGSACGCGCLALVLVGAYMLLNAGPFGIVAGLARAAYGTAVFAVDVVGALLSPVGIGVLIILLLLSAGKIMR